jgi:hypothetical protein
MLPMNTTTMIVAALLVLALVFWLRKKSGSPRADEDFSPADFRVRLTRPLTKNELKVLRLLQSALPECLLLPQVSLSRFMQVHENRSYHTWFHKVGRRCVDILICTSNGDVLGVVDLEDGASRSGDSANKAASQGTARKVETLRRAKVPIWRFDPNNLPSHDLLRDMVLEQWQVSQLRPPSGSPASQWPQTELAPRREGLEVTEADLQDDSQWQAQPWPTQDARPSDFLDQFDGATSRRGDLR